METGNWHEKVYFGSKACNVKWWNKDWSPYDMVFTSDGCIGGLKLNFCKLGACDEDNEKDASEESVVSSATTATTTTTEEATRFSVMALVGYNDLLVKNNNLRTKEHGMKMTPAEI
jgi:hypothetical protein